MKTKSTLIESLFSWCSAGVCSGLAYRLVKSSVPGPANQLHQAMPLLAHRQRRRLFAGVAVLLLAGLPLVGHAGGLITAWGGNSGGQTNVPPNVTNVLAIAAGTGFSLALKDDGTVAAWGTNILGETAVPSGLTNVTAIAAGAGFGLALETNGTVAAWGDNTYGETDVPAGLSNVVAIAAGFEFGLALTSRRRPHRLGRKWCRPEPSSGVEQHRCHCGRLVSRSGAQSRRYGACQGQQ